MSSDLTAAPRHRFVFISSNDATWGGSEELWSRAAIALAEQGHAVRAFKESLDEEQPCIRGLRERSCAVDDLSSLPLVPRPLSRLVHRLARFLAVRHHLLLVRLALAVGRADLVVISQGVNFDGALLAQLCRRLATPYVLIAQKAGALYWPPDATLESLRAAYRSARACYFVSEHNRQITEEQLGFELEHASVVRNPFLVPWERQDGWPSEREGLRLACVGRLYPVDKGQDILIRVLARPRWRDRPLSVTFFGSGTHDEGLRRMAAYYQLTNVTFAGLVSDAASIWTHHHGLILPSRSEGLPLVLVEAMLSGRLPIATAVAGHREVVEDGSTGFLASAPTEDALDEAMERAWQCRDEWRAIGAAATDRIRTLVPRDPARHFAIRLLEVASGTAAARERAIGGTSIDARTP